MLTSSISKVQTHSHECSHKCLAGSLLAFFFLAQMMAQMVVTTSKLHASCFNPDLKVLSVWISFVFLPCPKNMLVDMLAKYISV